ncbi:hypothetical protein J6590_007971 [Homalodisca vitripennis]|nr:hypothetical protein J6590_007971 [Homalodisca vitripennis]
MLQSLRLFVGTWESWPTPGQRLLGLIVSAAHVDPSPAGRLNIQITSAANILQADHQFAKTDRQRFVMPNLDAFAIFNLMALKRSSLLGCTARLSYSADNLGESRLKQKLHSGLVCTRLV